MTVQVNADVSTNKHKYSFTEDQTINVFLQSLLTLQEIDRALPLQYAVCLVEIARDEGISPSILSQRTNLGLSTVSRIIAALGDHRPNGRSYQLIHITTATGERRRKTLYLTAAGRKAIHKILGCLTSK